MTYQGWTLTSDKHLIVLFGFSDSKSFQNIFLRHSLASSYTMKLLIAIIVLLVLANGHHSVPVPKLDNTSGGQSGQRRPSVTQESGNTVLGNFGRWWARLGNMDFWAAQVLAHPWESKISWKTTSYFETLSNTSL